MNFYIGITDQAWFDNLSSLSPSPDGAQTLSEAKLFSWIQSREYPFGKNFSLFSPKDK